MQPPLGPRPEPRGPPEPGGHQERWAEPGPPPKRLTEKASGTLREHRSCCKTRRKHEVKISNKEREKLWGVIPRNAWQITKHACRGGAFDQDPRGSGTRAQREEQEPCTG